MPKYIGEGIVFPLCIYYSTKMAKSQILDVDFLGWKIYFVERKFYFVDIKSQGMGLFDTKISKKPKPRGGVWISCFIPLWRPQRPYKPFLDIWEYKHTTEKIEPYRGTEWRLSVVDKMGKVSTEKCVIPQKSEFSELFDTKWRKSRFSLFLKKRCFSNFLR